MGKLDNMHEYRNQGIAFARKVVAQAQAHGLDPVKVLDAEISKRHALSMTVRMTRQEWEKESDCIKTTTIKTMLSACMVVLWEQFGFGKVRLLRLMENFYTYVDALNEGSITWFDITDLLYEKTGVEIDLRDDDIRGKVRAE